MNKNLKDLTILYILIFFGINYGLYSYYLLPRLERVGVQKKLYMEAQKNLEGLKQKASQVDALKSEVKSMEEATADIVRKIPENIDTPQLVYDFYNACIKYGVKGEDIEFSLGISNDKNQGGSETGSGQKTAQSNTVKLDRLEIILNVSGSSDKIVGFINNLNDITKRTINVKSITIKSSQGDGQTVVPDQGSVSAQIVFYQYILNDGMPDSNGLRSNSDSIKIGFDKVEDMFR